MINVWTNASQPIITILLALGVILLSHPRIFYFIFSYVMWKISSPFLHVKVTNYLCVLRDITYRHYWWRHFYFRSPYVSLFPLLGTYFSLRNLSSTFANNLKRRVFNTSLRNFKFLKIAFAPFFFPSPSLHLYFSRYYLAIFFHLI